MNVELIANPVREEHDVLKQNRRMDSFARLLALSEVDSPCIAVALVGEAVVLSFNQPANSTINRVEGLLKNKMGILRQFLQDGLRLSEDDDLDKVIELIKKTRKSLMESGSHSTELLPAAKRKRQNMEKFMDVALGKLLTAVIKKPENGGLSDRERVALLDGHIILLAPKQTLEREVGATLHAEQMLADYVSRHAQSDSQKMKTYVGISKLCCAACRDVLSGNPAVAFRGSHGMTFPNVVDTRDATKMKYTTQTKLSGISFADDSDSEPDEADYKSAGRVRVKAGSMPRVRQLGSQFFSAHANDGVFADEAEAQPSPANIISAFK